MVQIVRWLPSVALPLNPLTWGEEYMGEETYSTLTSVPSATASILWDRDDATYVDSGPEGPDVGGKSWVPNFHADHLTPERPIPHGQPLWVRFYVRVETYDNPIGTGWAVEVCGWINREAEHYDRSFYGDGLYDLQPGDGITTGELTLHAEPGVDTPTDWYGRPPEDLAVFSRGYPYQQAVLYAFPPGKSGRFYELWVEVAYEGTPEHPLRQIQRDDHLAAGSPRATAGTSRQGSIRQRGYE